MYSTINLNNIKYLSRVYSSFIPKHKPVEDKDVQLLKDFIFSSVNLVALTGAGISTESGIPDYRSEGVGLYARTNHKPIQYQEFIKHPHTRQRYWARNFVGWERFSSVQPNDTHKILQHLEEEGPLSCVITQNVDNLHQKAGSQNVITLHGSAFTVICTNCNTKVDRYKVQEELKIDNPMAFENIATMIRPDGDVEIPLEFVEKFKTPKCKTCHYDLKPDIVFFGDNVPKAIVHQVEQTVHNCDSLLVLGSSLQVFSSYRIILQALDECKNICIVNIGPTRADKLIDFKIAAKCSEILAKVLL